MAGKTSNPPRISGPKEADMLARHLMDADFAAWRVWAATTRDGFPEGHRVREKAVRLCEVMDAYYTAWLLQRRPNSAQNLTAPLEKPIEKLVSELLRLGVSPAGKD
jgi:hypothetical protein